MDLPLAANDAAGEWKISVRELLNHTEGASGFSYQPAAQCGAIAGATPRAVYFGNDRDNIYRLLHTQQDVTIVKGAAEYNSAAAERIATALKPWGVQCRIITAAEAGRIRSIAADEAPTWVGLEPGRVEAGEKNSPSQVGFALRGPAILLGTPEDNALIKFALDAHMLAYKPDPANFPGRSRGYLGWQRDAVSYGQESVTLIAYDAAGMSEAVGSLYEAVAGIEPLTKWDLPASASVTPAFKSTSPPEAPIAWRSIAPDRVESLSVKGTQINVTTADGSSTQLDLDGKIVGHAASEAPSAADAKIPDALAKAVISDRIVKQTASEGGLTAIAYWGGTVQICDSAGQTKSLQLLPGDVGGLAWIGHELVLGLSDGSVLALKP